MNMLSSFDVAMGPGAFIRRTAIENYGGRNVKFKYVGDLEYWFLLALHGKLAHIPMPLATHLGAALECIIAQTDADWESIVVNDGSSDAARQVMEKYAEKDLRIRLIHKPNGEVASALNVGLQSARGQWVCWLSFDDMYASRKLEIHRDWIKRYPECRFFLHIFASYVRRRVRLQTTHYGGPLPEREFQLLGLFYQNYISGITVCIDREAWLQTGLFDESLRYGQDYDMWLRLLSVYTVRFIPEWTSISRNHALQGSEVFPQACYYDTAKAIIRFLNTHRFNELFPLLDLADSSSITQVVQKTLDVATEPARFIYSLGPHPALLFRLIEWVWDTDSIHDEGLKRELKKIISKRMADFVRRYDGTIFALWGKALFAAIQSSHFAFRYVPLSPSLIGEMYFYASQSTSSSVLLPLQQYLKTYKDLQVQEWAEHLADYEILIILPFEISSSNDNAENISGVLKISTFFSQRGCRVLLAGFSKQSLGMLAGVMFLGAEDAPSLKRILPKLGWADVLVSLNGKDVLKWVKARRKIEYPQPASHKTDAKMGETLYEMVKNAPDQVDYFQILGEIFKMFGKAIWKRVSRLARKVVP